MNEKETLSTIINNQLSSSFKNTKIPQIDDKSSIYYIKEEIKHDKILEPLEEYKSQVIPLEKELFQCLNLKWGEDIITEDMPLIDNGINNYYIHFFRTAKPNPNKENFFFIHGFLSSGLTFIFLIPYLIKRYNIFIPDIIGMGLSSRPQIKFTSARQCEDYFINIFHLVIKNIFFKGKYNIKEEFYLCGHSLGGLFASRYMLKYPKGIKKVLLLSPAGITDYRIPGTNINRDNSFALNCFFICFTNLCCWPCRLRIQNLYNCCCCHNFIKKQYGTYIFNIYEDEIRKNPDGSNFKVDKEKISLLLRKLAELSLDYPDDLNECIYYLLAVPPPGAYLPIEKQLMENNRIQIIFVYGEKDLIDKIGAYRLQSYNKDIYKVFTIMHEGHFLPLHNPKEVCVIIGQFFE